MNLVEELKELANLKSAGLLTDEQFEEAKNSVLKQHGGGAAPAPAATPAVGSAPGPAVTDLSPRAGLQALCDCNAVNHDVEACCELLGKLLSNILRAPQEAKYRTVKRDNAKLAAVVFSIPAAPVFLKSLGFAECDAGYEVYDIRVYRENQIRRRRALDETRREVIAAKTADGTIIAHCRRELLGHDDLASVAATLTRIVERVLSSPDDAKYRRVKVTEAFRNDCWQRGGVQEFFIALCGWDVEEVEAESSTLPPAVALQLSDGADVLPRQREALSFLQATCEEWEREREAEEEEKRAAARAQAKAIMQAQRELRAKANGGGAVGGAGAAAKPAGSGKRIPISEALRYLKGDSMDAPPDPTCIQQEEDLTATSLISEITGFIQLHHERQGSSSLVNHWRKEGERLRQKFKEDRDVASLHALKEEWEAKVLNPAAAASAMR